MLPISYIKHNAIDKLKWDNCISNSHNHLVYAESWYLDIVCSKQWDALIMGDYDAVMPLPLKRKYGVTYVQQPLWTQQLGVFSSTELKDEVLNKFIDAIPEKLMMISINLNERNVLQYREIIQKTNYVLSLNREYDQLIQGYSANTRYMLRRYITSEIAVLESTDVDAFIAFVRANRPVPIDDKHYITLSEIARYILDKGKGKIILVRKQGRTIAAALFLISKNRIIYRAGISSSLGKEHKAMFFLLDHVIHQYANSDYIFDFEGSEIKGIAHFFKGFGSTNRPYFYFRRYNNILFRLVHSFLMK